jgi:hypothetical protein
VALAQASAGPARAEQLLQVLSADQTQQELTGPLLGRARHALKRAQSARQAGDQTHRTQLEALALELLEAARALVLAVQAERELGALEKRAADTETRAVRAQALVEQTAARRGRAAEQLKALQTQKTNLAQKRPAKPAAQGAR